jgi:hypothetical protein
VVAIAAAAVAGLLLLLLVVVPALVQLTQRTTPSSSTARTPARGASPAATAPAATPTPQQALTGAVTGFQLTPQGSCQPGARCTIRVQVNIERPQTTTDVTWTLKVTDVCHGNATTNQPGSSVSAQAGWPFVFGLDSVTLPDSGKVQVVAQTSAPATATSDPLTIGSGC